MLKTKKILLEEIKDDTRLSVFIYYNLTKNNIVEMSVLPKSFNWCLQKPNDVFCRNRKVHPKFHMWSQRTLNKNFFKEQTWMSHNCQFQVLLKAMIIKVVRYQQILISGIKRSEINVPDKIDVQMYLDKVPKLLNGNKGILSLNDIGELDWHMKKKWNWILTLNDKN